MTGVPGDYAIAVAQMAPLESEGKSCPGNDGT